jgi:hypothetical protein
MFVALSTGVLYFTFWSKNLSCTILIRLLSKAGQGLFQTFSLSNSSFKLWAIYAFHEKASFL